MEFTSTSDEFWLVRDRYFDKVKSSQHRTKLKPESTETVLCLGPQREEPTNCDHKIKKSGKMKFQTVTNRRGPGKRALLLLPQVVTDRFDYALTAAGSMPLENA